MLHTCVHQGVHIFSNMITKNRLQLSASNLQYGNCDVNFGVNWMYSYRAMAASVRNSKYTASMPAEGEVPNEW